MESEQTTTANTPAGQQIVSQAKPRKARRGATPVAFPKAWLVLLAALAMIILEGAFRKWVPLFGEGIWKYLMYFSKDIIFAGLLFFPRRAAPSHALQTFQNWLLPGCALLLVGAAMSSIHDFNPVGALLTTRACIILPLLALMVVPRLAGLPLRRVALLLAFFTLLNFALGVEQNRLGPDSFWNRYAAADMQVVDTQSGVRAAGTFSYITGIEILSSVGIWAGLVLLGLAKKHWQRIGAWVTLAAGAGCGLVSVSRAPIVVGVAMVAGWLFLSRESITVLVRGFVAGAFCIIIATGFGITPVFSELGQGLMQRSEGAGDTFQGRAFGQLGEMVTAAQMAPLGHGFGTEQVGGQYYSTGEAGFNHFESPLPRLVMETGVLGLIGYLVICAGALLALQKAKREAQSAGARSALLATQLLFLPLFYGSLIFDHTTSAFVWMLLAAVLAGIGQNRNEKVKSENSKAENRRQGAEIRNAPFSVTQNKIEV